MKKHTFISKIIAGLLLFNLAIQSAPFVPSIVTAQSTDATPSPIPSSDIPALTPGLSAPEEPDLSQEPSPTPAFSASIPAPAPIEESIFTPPSPDNPFISPALSPTAPPTLAPTLTDSPNSAASANLKKPLKLRPLANNHFSAKESIVTVVNNGKDYQIETGLIDPSGQLIDLLIEKENNVDFATLRIPPSLNLKPGKYTLTVKDGSGNSDSVSFSWGNLALNLNKSIYQPDEKAVASLSIADIKGKIVCDAQINIEIKKDATVSAAFSTTNNSIQTHPECQKHNQTTSPDYRLTFNSPSEEGIYEISAKAVYNGNTYISTDTFRVSQSPLSVERIAATRFHPQKWQTVELKITALEDFNGTVSDQLPDIIDLAVPEESQIKTYDRVITGSTWYNRGSILGTAIPGLHLPFTEKHFQTLGFGDNLIDPLLIRMYSQFGLAGHDGIDFNLKSGTPVLAADSGMIVLAGQGDYGTTVVIQHDWGKSYYGHLSQVAVTLGQRVSKGQQVALSGNTGLSTGAHLHFGIKPNLNDLYNGYYGKINPLPYLDIPQNIVSNVVSPAGLTSTSITRVKKLSWNLTLNKGDSLSLGYRYKTPADPSVSYLIGPLSYASDSALSQPADSPPETGKISSPESATGSLWQTIGEFYEKPGAQITQPSQSFSMLKIDPELLKVPDDYPPQKALFNEDIIGQYTTTKIKNTSPSFTVSSIATDSSTINWLRMNMESFTLTNQPEIAENNQIIWRNIKLSTDLVYETYDGYLDQKIILRQDTADKQFTFSLEKADNLSVEDYFGHLLVKDNKTEEELFLLRFPQGIDADNNRIDYKYSLEGDKITLYPNRFRQFEKAVYPITVYAPINIIAWNEVTVQVGESCPDPACGKDGDANNFRPAGWYWGAKEKTLHVQIKVPKFTDSERRELNSSTNEIPDEDESKYPQASSEEKKRYAEAGGLARYGIDYTKLTDNNNLKRIRDKKKKQYNPKLDAGKEKSVIIKKSNPLSSVISSDRRYAFQPDSDLNKLTRLLKKVINPAIAANPNISTIGSASRDYSCIQGSGCWEDSVNGDLTASQQIEEGDLYADSTFTLTAPQLINGSTTSSSYYMHLTAPVSERHNGTEGTGVVLTGNVASSNGCINIRDNFTRLEWFEVTACSGGNTAAINISDEGGTTTDNILVQNLIIHGYPCVGFTCHAARFGGMGEGGSVTFRNIIIYDGDTNGTGIQGDGSNVSGLTVDIQNISLYGSNISNGFNEDDGGGCTESVFNITNTISVNTTTSDFNVNCGTLNNLLCEDNDSDCNAGTVTTCTDCLYNQSASIQFVNVSSGTEDLHLTTGSTAIDAGTDLSGSFTTDIDNRSRPIYAAWDIGADEFGPTNDQLLSHGQWFNYAGSRQPFTF